MGKTSRPLKILCVGIWGDEFIRLQEQGHIVDQVNEGDVVALVYDLIVGPRCWRLFPHLIKYLPLALKEARAAQAVRGSREKVGG